MNPACALTPEFIRLQPALSNHEVHVPPGQSPTTPDFDFDYRSAYIELYGRYQKAIYYFNVRCDELQQGWHSDPGNVGRAHANRIETLEEENEELRRRHADVLKDLKKQQDQNELLMKVNDDLRYRLTACEMSLQTERDRYHMSMKIIEDLESRLRTSDMAFQAEANAQAVLIRENEDIGYKLSRAIQDIQFLENRQPHVHSLQSPPSAAARQLRDPRSPPQQPLYYQQHPNERPFVPPSLPTPPQVHHPVSVSPSPKYISPTHVSPPSKHLSTPETPQSPQPATSFPRPVVKLPPKAQERARSPLVVITPKYA